MTIPLAPPQHTLLRIGVVQFNPKIGQVAANISRAHDLCRGLQPHSLDLLCFPEMAFTGYVFDSATSISPYLEPPHTGPTSLFAKEIATHLGCYVAAGYPERLPPNEVAVVPLPSDHPSLKDVPRKANTSTSTRPTTFHTPQTPTITQVGANSAVIYGPTGERIGAYRKTNLFETDMTWAKPGPGFVSFSLPLPPPTSTSTSSTSSTSPSSSVSVSSSMSGSSSVSASTSSSPSYSQPPQPPTTLPLPLTLAICMDLNPFPSGDLSSYDLADFCITNNTRVLVMLDAWLFSGHGDGGDGGEREEHGATEGGIAGEDGEDGEKDAKKRNENLEEQEQERDNYNDDDDEDPDWYTLRYWTARLQPLWKRDNRRRGSNETIYSSGGGGGGGEGEGGGGEGISEAVAEEKMIVDDEVKVVSEEVAEGEGEGEEEKPPHETIVVVCNRTGSENGKTFAGSSAIFSMRAGSGRPKLLDMMGRREEGVRVWNLLV